VLKTNRSPKELWLPALRGVFGDWVFYSCLMPLREIASRVDYAHVLHKSSSLSDMIQRQLETGRAEEIATYLKTHEQRFFNSLVIAVYGGNPSWHDIGDFSSNVPGLTVEKIPEQALNSFGLLLFSGEEKLFALDGQHRLAGIKSAVENNDDLGEEEASIVLVAHQNTPRGIERTRRLFTTLNKTARPVSKGEIIALDEDDVMAIVVRRLVESHPFFTNDRVAFVQTNNLPPNDTKHLTTIGNLYDILEIIFARIRKEHNLRDLKFNRPSDDELDNYYKFASRFFKLLAGVFLPLGEFLESKDASGVVKKYRGQGGGNVMFRPIGLTMMTEVIAQLSETRKLKESVEIAGILPQDLAKPPYAGILWDTTKKRMDNQGKALARDLLLFTLNEIPKKRITELGKRYARAVGRDPEDGQSLLEELTAVRAIHGDSR
jgi:DNA sulfur modification protein DndB